MILKELGFGVEILSPYELWLVKHLGFNADDIVVTGLHRNTGFCEDVAATNPKMWTLDSLSQLQYLVSVSNRFTTPVNVGLRICPSIKSSRFNVTVTSGTNRSPHGFMINHNDIETALNLIAKCDRLNFAGFHFHLGSGIQSSRPYRLAFDAMSGVIQSTVKMGYQCRYINIGGGFGSSAAPMQGVFDLFRSFLGFNGRTSEHNNQNKLISEVAMSVKEFLEELQKSGIELEQVLVEPGRTISASTQIVLLTVQEVVERSRNRTFLICDAGAMSLSPAFLVEHHRIMPLKKSDAEAVNYTILGNMPTSMDIVSGPISLPRMKPGDRIAVLDTGAYNFSFNNNFAGPRPGVVLIENGSFREIRSRESFQDIAGFIHSGGSDYA